LSDRALAVFVKLPRPGLVKTRLLPVLGQELAADLYRALAERVLAATTPRRGDYERLVFFDPPDAGEAMRSWLPAGRLRRQEGADLGARMRAAFDRVFARGARQAVLIGSDEPRLSRADVLLALGALERHDLVLGPALDGGYYLVGLRRSVPALFDGIDWSSGRVLEDTRARAEAEGLAVTLLEPRRDIDTAEDLAAEWPSLAAFLERELRERVERALGARQLERG
jgi:hypothetical protein